MVRFYGGEPMIWLSRTPMAVVEAHLEMMDRLKAEEAMQHSQQIAMGSRLKAGRDVWSRWQRAARGTRRDAVKHVQPANLASVGIGFRKVNNG